MSAGRRGFLGVTVTRERMQGGFTVAVDPPVIELRTTTPAGSVQSIELTPKEFAKLVEQTAAAAAFMLRDRAAP